MRLVPAIIGGATIAILGACSNSNDAESKTQPAESTSPLSIRAVEDVKALAPGDPDTHTFRVTIRDVRGVNQYRVKADGTCVANAPKEFPPQLVVSGAMHYTENGSTNSFDIPGTAQVSQGACESQMTITVPRAARYTMGIGMEGRGIANPDAPERSWIDRKGSNQKVTVVSQVVTVVK